MASVTATAEKRLRQSTALSLSRNFFRALHGVLGADIDLHNQ